MSCKINSTLIVFFLLFLGLNNCFSQRQNLIGINTYGEYNFSRNFGNSFGLSYERKINAHFGLETGISMRNSFEEFNSNLTLPSGTIYIVQKVRESFLSIPLGVKYYTPVVNAAIGLNADYFADWEDESSDPNTKITEYSVSPKLNWGGYAKVSKPFNFSHSVVLEPEIRFSYFNQNTYYYGLGISLKYSF